MGKVVPPVKRPKRGYLHFDWLCPGHVRLGIAREDRKASACLYLTTHEAEVVGRRLIAWAAYQRAKTRKEKAKQPDNGFIIGQPLDIFPSEDDQRAALRRISRSAVSGEQA